MDYFRKKSTSTITQKEMTLPQFEILDEREKLIKLYYAVRNEIEINNSLKQFKGLPIIAEHHQIIEELSKTTKKSYNVY